MTSTDEGNHNAQEHSEVWLIMVYKTAKQTVQNEPYFGSELNKLLQGSKLKWQLIDSVAYSSYIQGIVREGQYTP